MRTMVTITKREFKSYFNSPVAYIVISAFLVILGIRFFVPFFAQDRVSLRGFFSQVPFLFIFFIPAITMRLVAEEKRSGTIEMLITMPVRDVDVILGKFIASLMFLLVALILTLPYAITVSNFGNLDWGPVWGGYLGLVLMGAACLSMGLLASAWSENQIVAFVVTFFASMLFMTIDMFVMFVPAQLSPVFEYLSFTAHFRNMARGMIDSRDVVFFMSFAVLSLFLAFRSLESRQWR